MKETLSESQFVSRFLEIRPDNFSRPALCALFEYYDQMEQDTGEEIEFDPVAICCDWAEYATALEAANEMSSFEPDPEAEADDQETAALEYLRDNTTVLEAGDSVVVLSF